MIRLASDRISKERTYIICENDAAPKIANLQECLVHYEQSHDNFHKHKELELGQWIALLCQW